MTRISGSPVLEGGVAHLFVVCKLLFAYLGRLGHSFVGSVDFIHGQVLVTRGAIFVIFVTSCSSEPLGRRVEGNVFSDEIRRKL